MNKVTLTKQDRKNGEQVFWLILLTIMTLKITSCAECAFHKKVSEKITVTTPDGQGK